MNREEFDDEYYQQKMMEHRIRMEKRRVKTTTDKRQHILLFFLLLLLLFLAFIGVRYALPYVQQQGGISFGKKVSESTIAKNRPVVKLGEGETEEKGDVVEASETPALSEKDEALKTAELQAKQYDYDSAIATLNALNLSSDTEISAKISQYEEEKGKLVPANMDDITHIFFHILIVDPTRALTDTHQGKQFNSVMTTIPEFEEIIKEMYDRGYVMVHMHDLAEMQEQPDGTKKMVKKQIMLPEGKKPFVMSQDDVNYYVYMEGHGFADKMVLDENGKPKNQYTDKDGNVTIGDYDLVPILDKFVEEHPDFAYHGH